MRAVVLTGHGGPDKLVCREDVAVPQPGADEVLIEVAACGMNNTDINTRTGWYSRPSRLVYREGPALPDCRWERYPLNELAAAQEAFMAKSHVGNIVIEVAR